MLGPSQNVHVTDDSMYTFNVPWLSFFFLFCFFLSFSNVISAIQQTKHHSFVAFLPLIGIYWFRLCKTFYSMNKSDRRGQTRESTRLSFASCSCFVVLSGAHIRNEKRIKKNYFKLAANTQLCFHDTQCISTQARPYTPPSFASASQQYHRCLFAMLSASNKKMLYDFGKKYARQIYSSDMLFGCMCLCSRIICLTCWLLFEYPSA